MKYEKGTFTTVPNIEKLKGINPIAQTIFMWICQFSNQDGTCYPSQRKLAECCSISIDSCRKYLKVLEENGFLVRNRRYKDNTEISSQYAVVVGGSSQPVPPSTEQGGVVVEKGEGASTERDRTKPIELNPINKTITKVIEDEPKEYGNKDINLILKALRKTIGIDTFRETQKLQRMYGKHLSNLLGKIGKDEFRKRLDQILSDNFKRKNCNSLKYLYSEIKSCLPEQMNSNFIPKF